jgi:putative membrane protein
MKFFLKAVFVNGISLALVSYIFAGLSYGGDLGVLLVASVIFAIINFFLKPIIKLFLLPINLISLGLLGWLTGVFCLLVLTIFIPQIQIKSFQYSGYSFAGFTLPPFYFTTLFSLVMASFLLSLTSSFIYWLFKK